MIYIRQHTLILFFTLLLTPIYLYAQEVPSVSFAVAVKGQWHSKYTAFGYVSPLRESVLSVPFNAHVTAVKTTVGEPVEKGQILASLQSPKLMALLSRVHATQQEVGLAERKADTLVQSLREKAVTRSTVLEAEIDFVKTNNHLAEAWQALDDALLALGQQPDHNVITKSLKKFSITDLAARLSVLRAPFDALVVERHIAPGQQLSENAPIFVIKDLYKVYIEVGVPREQLSDWQSGTASVAPPAGPRALTPVSTVPRLDPGSGLWLLLYITDNPKLQLQDGDWLKLNLSGPARTVVWVPESSVVARNGQTYCIKKRDGKLEAIAVTIGPAEEGRVPVLSGLKVNDQVVTEGAYELLYRDLKELMKFVD